MSSKYAGNLWGGTPRHWRCDEEGRREITVVNVRVRILSRLALNFGAPYLKKIPTDSSFLILVLRFLVHATGMGDQGWVGMQMRTGP